MIDWPKLSKHHQIIDALTGPWTIPQYTRYLGKVWNLPVGNDIQMDNIWFHMEPGSRNTPDEFMIGFADLDHWREFYYKTDPFPPDEFLAAHNVKHWRDIHADPPPRLWLPDPRGGRHLVLMLEYVDSLAWVE